MRRLFLLLIRLVAFGALLPAAPAVATTAPAHHDSHTMPPGHCGDEGREANHVCLGCAVKERDPAPVAVRVTLSAPLPSICLALLREDHRPGFDPPSPRALG
jgi:hypothetical protein